MYKLIDARNVDWSATINSLSNGCYMKTKGTYNGKMHYVKLSNYSFPDGFTGFESVNEVIAGRLGKILGFPVVYQKLRKLLVHVNHTDYVTYGCDSESYKFDGCSRVSAGDFYRMYRIDSEKPLNTFQRCGFTRFLDMMFVFDFIIVGRDRHDSNIEFLISSDNIIKPAPLFDNGLSLLGPIQMNVPEIVLQKNINSFEEFRDVPVNNFIGYGSLRENLNFISNPVVVNRLKRSDRTRIFYNMSEVVSDYFMDKVWNIICYRYSYLRKLGLIVERR